MTFRNTEPVPGEPEDLTQAERDEINAAIDEGLGFYDSTVGDSKRLEAAWIAIKSYRMTHDPNFVYWPVSYD